MPNNTKDKSYLSKDFVSLRADILSYARTYFAKEIKDFSEGSMGGLLLDMAAYVGDTMTFYLDYQFKELNPMTATETANVVNHAKNAGVKVVGASPSSLPVVVFITVPAKQKPDGSYIPSPENLPVIKALNSTVVATNGVTFTFDEDLDFAEEDDDGNLIAAYEIFRNDSSGNPVNFICSRTVRTLSGRTVMEEFSMSATLIPFRTITLSNQDVSQIVSVTDSSNNEYYEVESLVQNTVYKRIRNFDQDKNTVPSSFEVIPAPYRFVADVSFDSRLTTIQFGSGDEDALDDDILPDPSELALPLYGKKVFSRFSIDPNSLMKTKTLGISPKNTIISVTYRYGGGLSHNIPVGGVNSVGSLNIQFPSTATDRSGVVNSISVSNNVAASGGAPPLSLADLKTQISSARNQQSRIVTDQDLLSRIYTLPNNYGRVVRAGLRKDERNPLATQLFILSQDMHGKLTVAPDALKMNISNYINEFRLISDAIDILDGIVINYGIEFTLICHPNSNKSSVVARVIAKLKRSSQIKYYQIDQPLVEADIINNIISTPGVLSLVSLSVNNLSGEFSNREYSDYSLDLVKNKFKGFYLGPPGSIFELRYPNHDIIGNAE